MKKTKRFLTGNERSLLGKIAKIMKLTTFILLVSTMMVSASIYSQNTKMSLKFTEISYQEMFKEIENQTEFRFAYSSSKLDPNQKIEVDMKKRTLEEILDGTLPEGVSYEIVDRYVVIMDAVDKSSMAELQQNSISGRVTDDNGEPLPGVTIIIKGTSQGTISDFEGNYTMTNIPAGSILQFSFVGMKTQEVVVDSETTINVVLLADAIGLEEVVAIGYGTQSKRDMTGSIQNLNIEELSDMPVPQVAQKLQGKLAGVQITQTTGIPGQGMTVRIRGQASISAGNKPLYVVDGTPIIGDLSSINPNEIESISVLKDASSTSLYGSRAANGVVLISTKRAKTGKTSVSVNSYYGIQTLPEKGRPDMMNAREFAQFQKELAIENGREVDPVYQNPEQYGEGTDWYDVLFRVAPIQNYNFQLSSGNDNFQTAASIDYYNMDGILQNSNYKRFSARINTDFTINDKLRSVINIAPTYSINETPQSDGYWITGGIIQSAILTTPLAPYKNDDGTIPLTATGPGLFANPNWYNVLNVVENTTKTSRLIANAFLEYDLFDDLCLKSNFSVELNDKLYYNFTPSTAGSLFNPPPQIPKATQNMLKYYSWMWENIATYKKYTENHSFEALAGITSQRYHADITNTEATNFPDDRVKTLNAATSTLTTSEVQEWTLLSGIARLNYSYKNKYLISAAIRADGSSRFGSENRWGYFPSVSAGWIISDEDFFSNINMINFMKLRTSYGVTGNNNIGNYTHHGIVDNINYVFDNVIASGRIGTTLGNADLGWEQTSQYDFGIELGLWNNRIFLIYDYYHKSTDNLLYQVDIPYASGYPNIMTNIGEIIFWGHEFSLSTKNTTGKLQWNTDFNIAFNNNEVKKLGTADAAIYGDGTITKVGEQIGQFYGYVMEGVYVDQADFDNSPKHISSVVGSAKMKDVDKDGEITVDDRTVIGSALPVFIYGITNNFKYKNFDLAMVISGSYGNDISYRTAGFTTNLDGVFNVEKEVANRWKSPEEPGNGRYGTTLAGATSLNREPNSTFIYDGSYLTLKNITIGYNVPLKESKFFSSVRLYGSIQQVFVLTGYKKGNPEVSVAYDGEESDPLNLGIDWTGYPVPRTFTVGVNLNF